MRNLFYNYKNDKKGTIALLLVIMITTLTLVSSIVLSMVNSSDMMSNYHHSESAVVDVGIDSCIDDAMYRISSSSDVSGNYSIDLGDTNCEYEIGATANGIKTVTTTASTTSGIGSWTKTVITTINVSTTPISIDSYKDSVKSFDSYILPFCGDGNIDSGEVCDDGNSEDETQTCGNGIVEGGTSCNSDCSAVINLTQETCDTGASRSNGCGNGVVEVAGDYCNMTCNGTTTINVNEVCDDNDLINEGCGNGDVEVASTTYCNSVCDSFITVAVTEVCDYWGQSCDGGNGFGYEAPGNSTCNAGKAKYCNYLCDSCSTVCATMPGP